VGLGGGRQRKKVSFYANERAIRVLKKFISNINSKDLAKGMRVDELHVHTYNG
jgi:hypothetical protein